MTLTPHDPSPIGIVGIGLRFPGGVRSLPAYGRLLTTGEPVLVPVPPERWGREHYGSGPGSAAHHVGAFLADVDRFDAAYFGIPPAEAALIDPQHRLFLEVAWEAMCDSGRPRDLWRGSRTGVVLGILASDYAQLHARTLGIEAIGPHHVTGLEFSFAAGRLAYAFDLHGPVQAVNSACSSALLAVHQACQYLRSGDCDIAVAGGVSLLLTPDNSVFLRSAGALSPTGRCRPFDQEADGIVRGEGCGVVVLRPLSEAIADGDRVLAVIRGSAVNNDGSSLGLTVPSGQAQADLLRGALRRAGLEPGDVDYVEAHGTGTPLGDLIELDALGAVYGAGHDADRPVYVGSHKALLGHMDAAAGMGGLLKAVWVTATGTIPAQPGVQTPNPAVNWRDGAIAVPREPVRTDTGRPMRAGVSAFGLSGTNVHVIVEAAPDADPADTPVPRPYLLLASALDAPGLTEQLTLLRAEVASAGSDLGSLVASAATRRTHETHRFAATAGDREELLAALADPGELPDGAYIGEISDPQDMPGPVFVFSGQGGQWAGMALDLYDTDPQVRAALDECAGLVRTEAGWSLLDELRHGPDGDRPDRIEIVQPAIFAVQVALVRWLVHRGVRPAAVIGHSLGEVAAAHVAGALDLADATRVVVRRAEVLAGFAGRGRMVAVAAGPDELAAAIGGVPVDVVAVNGPASVIIAGTSPAVEDAAAALERAGLRHRQLRVDAPAHSAIVAEGGVRLEAALRGLAPRQPAVRLLSTVDPADTRLRLDPAYWARNFTSPVRLWPAVDLLLAEEDYPLVEIGPHPVLLPPLTDAQRARQRWAPALGLLDRRLPGPTALARTLARLHVAGVRVDWEKAVGRPRRYRSLPVPSWRDGRHWLPGVRRGQQTGTAAPARVRVSLLDAAGRVTQELYAEPAAQPPPLPPRADGAAADGAARRPEPSPAAAPVSPPSAPRIAVLTEHIDRTVRELLGLSDDDPPLGRRRGLFEQGLDSLRAVALRRRLQEQFGTELPATIVIERPSIRGLAEYLAATVPAAGLDRAPEAGPDTGPGTGSDASLDKGPDGAVGPAADAVAVIGMACRLPGAGSLAEFWQLLADGRRMASMPPPGRRDDPAWQESWAGIPKRASYLADIAGFDAPFFRISPREAELLDPRQRLFLEVAWEALEDAGCPALTLAGRPAGVYAGVDGSEYEHLIARGMPTDDAPVTLHHGTGTSSATLAGRLSYLLGLHGPSLAVDTACSSSLTAVHLACQALRAGDCDLAVAGGTNAIVAPSPLMAAMAASGALSPDGECKTFDEDADGFGVGEGAVVLVLKTLAATRRDGDRVYAVLRASAVNSDGATGGMTVPNGAAQAALIRAAVGRAGWAPADVDYVEAHGTGTPLGDPVEVRALADALGPGRTADEPLLVGSAKANVGHLGAAAGAVGLLKVILALRAGQLPPHPLSRPSTRIDWDRLPVAPVRALTGWPRRGRAARAGVSAFGFSGTNVHVLVEQAPPPAPSGQPATAPPYLVPVSGATPAALRAAAARLAGVLRSADGTPDAIAYTATYRRSLLEHRAVVVGTDAAELAEALDHVAAGTPHPRVRTGRAAPGEPLSVAFRYRNSAPPRWPNRVYQQALAELAAELTRITGKPCDLRAGPDGIPPTVYAFCHQVAATRAWAALGVRPDAVVCAGNGTVAAWAAGRLDGTAALELLVAGIGDPPGDRLGPAVRPLTDAGADRVVDVLSDSDPALVAADLVATGFRPVPPHPGRPPVDLPPYPWEHKIYWYRGTGVSQGQPEPVITVPAVSWVLSAESADAVRQQARRLARFVRGDAGADTGTHAAQVGQALAGRPAAAHRAVMTGSSPGDLLAGLDAVAAGEAAPESVVSGVARDQVRPVLVFPGQGWQWAGMGRGLLASSPVFAQAVAQCSEVFEELAGWSVLQVLREGRDLDQVDVVQPVMFAVMVGLARLWHALGVVPAAVVGHSQGEIAAACVAGALDLREAARVVLERSAALRELSGRGAMISVTAGAEQVRPWLADGWHVAAVNGPRSTVVCGPAQRAEQILERCEHAGARARMIIVDYASHSPDVERIRDQVLGRLGTVASRPNQVLMYSTVTGKPADGAAMDARYWYDNLRRPVRFQDAIEALIRAGHTTFIECSAHPVLVPAIEQTLDALAVPAPERPAAIPTLRRDDDSPARLHTIAAQAWTHGVGICWPALLPRAVPAELADLDRPEPVTEPAVDAVDRRFWRSVDEGQAKGLAAALDLDERQEAALAGLLPALARWRRRARELATIDAWRYRSAWRPAAGLAAAPAQPAPDRPESPPAGTWLVAIPRDLVTDPFVAACLAAIPQARPLPVRTDPSRADLAAELRHNADRPLAGVLSLLALDETSHLRYPAVPAGLLSTAVLLQALDDCGLDARLWSATRAAVAVTPGESVVHPVQAHVMGLSRTAGVETPHRWGGLIDLPRDLDDAAVAGLRAVLAASPAEDQVAVRADGIYVRRLVRAPVDGTAPGRHWTPRGTTLITGGTGALGRHVARWLARHGAPHLLLLSRRGPDAPGTAALGSELVSLGAQVTIAACDAADREALGKTIAEIPAEHPLTAVIHTAGVVDDAPIAALTGAQLQAVLTPKTAAVQALHEATAGHELSAFVIFSSFSSMLPNVGQGAYAAANAYLDAFAQWGKASGLPALSVGWGAWAGEGMAADPAFATMISRGWMELMTAHLAVIALHQALDHGDTTVGVADLSWASFTGLFPGRRPYPLVQELLAGSGRDTGAAALAALLARLSDLPAQRRHDEVLAVVCAEVAVVLGSASAGEVPPDQAFRDLGFDSVTAIELRNRLTAATGVAVQATAVFDYPTPAALADHLLERLTPRPVPEPGGPAAPDGHAPDRFDAMDVADLVRAAREIAT